MRSHGVAVSFSATVATCETPSTLFKFTPPPDRADVVERRASPQELTDLGDQVSKARWMWEFALDGLCRTGIGRARHIGPSREVGCEISARSSRKQDYAERRNRTKQRERRSERTLCSLGGLVRVCVMMRPPCLPAAPDGPHLTNDAATLRRPVAAINFRTRIRLKSRSSNAGCGVCCRVRRSTRKRCLLRGVWRDRRPQWKRGRPQWKQVCLKFVGATLFKFTPPPDRADVVERRSSISPITPFPRSATSTTIASASTPARNRRLSRR